MARQTNSNSKIKGAVIYATEQGLGRQAKSFFDNGLFTEVLIQKHSSYTNHYDWYPNAVKNFDELLEKCDEIWFLETPFDQNYIIRAREKGVRTVLFLMYECSKIIYLPDQLVGGSIMEKNFGDTVKVINVPAPKEIKWKLRKKALTFIMNAGHGGIGGRNGTKQLLEALKLTTTPFKMIIRSQIPLQCSDPRVDLRIGDFPYESLYEEGDVFVYPDKFGGSCLPVQEAHSAGMMCMVSKRLPHTEWLPNKPMIPVKGYTKERIAEKEFDSAIIEPKEIAKCLDYWYDKDITEYSKAGKKWAEANSWKVLKSEYEKI